jgi:hypothetical protein
VNRPPHPFPRGVRAIEKRQRYAIIGCGSRDWRDYPTIERAIKPFPPGTIIIHGDQASWDPSAQQWYGADHLIDRAARKLGFEPVPIPYLSELGKAGGPERNKLMLGVLLSFANHYIIGVLAFDMGGRGTANMMQLARDHGVRVKAVPHP